MNRCKALAVSMTVVLTLGACGASSGEGSLESANDDGRPTSFEDLDFSSPLYNFLGYDMSAQDDMEVQFAEMERKAQEAAAACMQEQGFDYSPVMQPDFAFIGPGGEMDWFSPEWVEKYGLGISTMRFPQEMVGSDLVGTPQSMARGESFEDPNSEYVNSLSDGERDAYFEALYGSQPDFDPTSMSEEEMEAAFSSYEPSGCLPTAQDEMFSEFNNSGIDQQVFWETFGDELETMMERAESDPRVVEYRDRVSSCVSDAGWPALAGEQAIYEYFEDRMSGVGDFGHASIEVEADGDGDGEPPEMQMPSLSAESKAKLAEVQAEELEFAPVLLACDGGPLNEQWFIGQVRAELEQDFLDANAGALAELKE